MTYLIQRRGLSENTAKDLYGLFGGRIKSLQNAASKLQSGVKFPRKYSRLSFKVFSLIFRHARSHLTRYIPSDRED